MGRTRNLWPRRDYRPCIRAISVVGGLVKLARAFDGSRGRHVSLNYSLGRFDTTGLGLELRQGCPCFLGRVRVSGVVPEYPGGG